MTMWTAYWANVQALTSLVLQGHCLIQIIKDLYKVFLKLRHHYSIDSLWKNQINGGAFKHQSVFSRSFLY